MALSKADAENPTAGNATAEYRLWIKCAWRLLPLLVAANVVSFIDRVNVGFAALTMNRDLGFSPSVYGFGAGVLFVGYALFRSPPVSYCTALEHGGGSASFSQVGAPHPLLAR